jgi:hypothetical protein
MPHTTPASKHPSKECLARFCGSANFFVGQGLARGPFWFSEDPIILVLCFRPWLIIDCFNSRDSSELIREAWVFFALYGTPSAQTARQRISVVSCPLNRPSAKSAHGTGHPADIPVHSPCPDRTPARVDIPCPRAFFRVKIDTVKANIRLTRRVVRLFVDFFHFFTTAESKDVSNARNHRLPDGKSPQRAKGVRVGGG